MGHLNVGELELFHQRSGDGEPLLLIQGMSGTTTAWGDPFVGALEAHFDVIRFDNRGMGRSTAVSDPFTIADMADDAAGVLDALGVETAHVLGISMGGMIAQELALRHPQRLRTLTLGCTYCGGPEARLAEQAVIERLATGMLSGDRELAIRTSYEVNVSQGFAGAQENFEPFRAMALAANAPVPVIMLQMQAIQAHDTSPRLKDISAPTLVIHGDEDQMLPVSNGRQIASLVPGARLEELEGVGHMFWWEQPERSAKLVSEHATRVCA